MTGLEGHPGAGGLHLLAGEAKAALATGEEGKGVAQGAYGVRGLPQTMFFLPHYTSVNRFLASRAGHRSVVSLNETGHLKG